MAIEIRELLIKVKVEEGATGAQSDLQLDELKHYLLKECRREVRRALSKEKER
jgi:hypothetical protein